MLKRSGLILLSTLIISPTFAGGLLSGIQLDKVKERLVINNNLVSVVVDLKKKKKKEAEPVPTQPAAYQVAQNKWLWVNHNVAQPIPRLAVIGGLENGAPLFICHAAYNNGIHPGKIVAGNCNISYAGQEIPMQNYQILVSQLPTRWVPARAGIPPNAVKGGHENGQPLFICQGNYHGGMHPGKVVGNVCDIGYGGREISLPQYRLLVL